MKSSKRLQRYFDIRYNGDSKSEKEISVVGIFVPFFFSKLPEYNDETYASYSLNNKLYKASNIHLVCHVAHC